MKRLGVALLILTLAIVSVPTLSAARATPAGNAAQAEPTAVGEDEPDWCSNGAGSPRTFDNLNSPSVKVHVNGNSGTSDASVSGSYADGSAFGPTTVPQGQSNTFQAHPTHGNVTSMSIESSESNVKTCGTLDAESPD